MINQTISHYKILEKLGEGGCGRCWMTKYEVNMICLICTAILCYRILEQIGQGGMGVVYKAIINATGEQVLYGGEP